MKKLIITLALLLTAASAAFALTGADSVRPGHWSYMSLRTLADEGLINRSIDLESTVLTGGEIFREIDKAMEAVKAKPEALTENSLISLRQLINAYKPIIEEKGKDFFLYRKELENCAIRAGLTAMETGEKTAAGTPLFSKASRSVNSFTLDLYSKLAADEKGNFMISPYSVSSALAMTYLGAKGKTAEEFEELLRFTPDMHRNMASLINETASSSEEEGIVRSANAVWPAESLKVKKSYTKQVKDFYSAEIMPQDYAKNSSGAAKTINKWVEDKTEGKIRDIIPAGALGGNTKLVLTNAVYFKADWADPFSYQDTRVKPFHPAEGEAINTSFMIQTMDSVRYGKHEGVQALELPYSMGRYSMLVLLPDKKTKLSELEKKLSGTYLFNLAAAMKEERVRVELPKFKTEYKTQLTGTLAEMGLKTAVSPKLADFSGISSEKGIFIDTILHKTFIEVGEKGTEAAAATAIMMRTMGLRPQEDKPVLFKADRPFMYLIRDNKTGAILFIGRYVKP